MQELHISVRNLVEFILRGGDIDNRRKAAADAMAEGSRIHKMIQKRMGSSYRAEVPLSYCYHTERYDIILEGRADGIIESEPITIDEIKGILYVKDILKNINKKTFKIKNIIHEPYFVPQNKMIDDLFRDPKVKNEILNNKEI